MKNEPVVNEISEDDVNDLSDQIRQLKVFASYYKRSLAKLFVFILLVNLECQFTGCRKSS